MKLSLRTLILLFSATMFVAGCASTSGKAPEAVPTRIEMPSYSITCPSGKDWKQNIDEVSEKIIFVKKFETFLLPGLEKVTSVEVFKNMVLYENWDMTAEEVAMDYFNHEEEIMRKQGEEKKEYKIKKFEKGSMQIGEKYIYKAYWKASAGGGWTPLRTTEGTLLLYFPPGFGTNHCFYMVLIVDGYIGIVFKHDPEPAHAIMASLTINDSK